MKRVASAAGVRNMAEFHNAGYKGLYNVETVDDIFKRKKLRYREDILDNMNEDELVANLFRINQTKQKLLKDNVQGEKEAKDVHYEVGKKVRKDFMADYVVFYRMGIDITVLQCNQWTLDPDRTKISCTGCI